MRRVKPSARSPRLTSIGYLRLSAPIDSLILQDVRKAAERLDADPERIRATPAEDLYGALEALGADRFPLAAVGSWQDRADDADVLGTLMDGNRHGRIEFDEVFASTSLPTPRGRTGL